MIVLKYVLCCIVASLAFWVTYVIFKHNLNKKWMVIPIIFNFIVICVLVTGKIGIFGLLGIFGLFPLGLKIFSKKYNE